MASESPLPDRIPGAIEIRLQQDVFDPRLSPPDLPPDLTVDSGDPEAGNYSIVQFHGPVLEAWRTELERRDAEIIDYVPDFAYIVRADAEALKKIRAMKVVRWVGVFQPAFRLSNNLLRNVEMSRPDVWIELVVRGFSGEPADRLLAALDASNATITHQYEDRGGGMIFRLTVPEASIQGLAHIPGIAWIEPHFEPGLANEIARSGTIMDQNRVESDLGLFGDGQMVGVGDTGLSTGDAGTVHQDFAGRVIGGTWGPGSCGTWADNNSHGTHVAGSVLGSGVQSGADVPGQVYAGSNAGIAPEADIYVWSFCNDFSGLPTGPYGDYYGVKYAVDPNLRISTNSWGYTGGFGQYNTFTRETDRFVRDFPDMIITYAAGNAGTDANGDGVVDSGSMNMPGTAKNVITVGASENVRGTNTFTWGGAWPGDFPEDPINSDLVADNVDGMAAFSGRGPTLSGRLKPDVVAPGTNIVSTRNESTGTGWGVYDDFYLYMGGTSMATPLVAGSSAVLREYFQDVHLINPGAALVKAMLINGAVDMTPGQYGAGATQDVLRRPDNSQGWGRVHMANSLIYEGGRDLLFEEHAGLNTSETHQVDFQVVDGTVPLRITLVWIDAPGTEASHGALVNDLDLEVTDHENTVHIGNSIITGGSPDRDNNIEAVDLPGTAGNYTVTVSGFNVPDGPQPFALVVSGGLGEEETFSLGAAESQVSVCSGNDGGFDLAVKSWVGFDDPVSLSVSGLPADASSQFVPNPVTPDDPAASATLTISDTGGVTGGDYALTIIGESNGPSFSPQLKELGLQLGVVEAPPADAVLSSPANGATDIGLQPELVWSSASGAEGYEIEVATDFGFSSVVLQESTSGTSFQVLSGLNPDTTYFWRVRSLNACGESAYSNTSSFTTKPVFCSNPGVAIPDDSAAGVDDDMALTASGSLDDLQVYIDASHSWVGDLRFELTHVESGTSVVLVNRPGVGGGSTFGCGNDNYDVWLDDSASGSVQDACEGTSPAIGGTLQPFEPLAGFVGVDRAGTWRLNASDHVVDDAGTLVEWCLATTYEASSYTVSAEVGSGNGSITPTSQMVSHGDTATLTVTPDPGWHIDSVSGCGGSLSEETYTTVAITADCTVTASFAIDTYTLTYTAGANGSISGTTPQTVDHGSDGTSVEAVPDTGYHFVQWSDASTANPRTDTNVQADVTVEAEFAINSYTVTFVDDGGSVLKAETVDHGSAATAPADPTREGYTFTGWDVPFDNVTGNLTVTAQYEINSYTLTYTAGANGSISGTSPQSVDYGSDGASVEAVPDAGYFFLQWSDGSTENPRTDAGVTSDVTVEAEFLSISVFSDRFEP